LPFTYIINVTNKLFWSASYSANRKMIICLQDGEQMKLSNLTISFATWIFSY